MLRKIACRIAARRSFADRGLNRWVLLSGDAAECGRSLGFRAPADGKTGILGSYKGDSCEEAAHFLAGAKIPSLNVVSHVDSITGEGFWLPGIGETKEIEASSVKKKRRKKMNKHKQRKLRRRDRNSTKKNK